jgi:PAS domain-containing protein
MTHRYFLTLAGDHPATNNELSSLLLLKSTQHQPFSYPPSYAKLLRYIDSFPPSPRDRVRSAIEKLWTCLEEREKDAGRSEAHLDALGLDLDTVFSSTGIPAAVWRRTGELLRSNREFASLVGQSPEKLAGKPVHELWNPESAANYFATFAGIAADPLQKAFLLPCSLKNGAGWLECTASFTVHREPWSGVPCAIVGNFLPLRPPSLESVLEARMEAFRIKEEEGVEEVRRLLGRGVKRGLSGMLGGLQGVEQPPMDELGLLGMDGQQGVDEFSEFVDGMAF